MPPNKNEIHLGQVPRQVGNVSKPNSGFFPIGANSGRQITISQFKPVVTNVSMPFGSGTYEKCKSTNSNDERDNANGGTPGLGSGQGSGGNQGTGQGNHENLSGSSGREGDRRTPENCNSSETYSDEELKKEETRLKTFTNWPLSYVTPASLAANGFYHIRNDLVRCAFCKIEIGKWVEGDIPMKEHKRWYGNCPFVRGKDCGNIPLSNDNLRPSRSRSDSTMESSIMSYDTCGIHEEMRPFSVCDDEEPSTSSGCRNSPPVMKVRQTLSESSAAERNPSSAPSLEKLGIRDMRAPKYPEYCTEAARLASYSLWPVAMKQRPNILAEAGFYYTGNGDQTICFHCGGGLRDWEEGDDPWIEHAKWFSRCHFLILVKGNDFINQITESRPALINAEEAKSLVNSCPMSNMSNGTASMSSYSPNMESVANGCSSTPNSLITTTEKLEEVLPVSRQAKEGKDEACLCKICYAAELGVVFLPCGHMVACVKCAPSLTVCPVCRQQFTHTVRAYIP